MPPDYKGPTAPTGKNNAQATETPRNELKYVAAAAGSVAGGDLDGMIAAKVATHNSTYLVDDASKALFKAGSKALGPGGLLVGVASDAIIDPRGFNLLDSVINGVAVGVTTTILMWIAVGVPASVHLVPIMRTWSQSIT
jgi:hypothetical protein